MIDIVIPVYNEGKNIAKQLRRVEASIKSRKRVLIVYDSEQDDTLPVLAKIKNKFSFPIITIRNYYGKGALNAIKTGLEAAKNEAVLVIMADLSDSLEIVDKMYWLIRKKGFDLVCGSRYMKGGKQYGGPLLKGMFSRCAGLSLHAITGIPTHDISNSFKMYRKSMLKNIKIESTGGFEIGMEITVKAFLQGYKITEIPSKWYDRSDGESHFKMWEWMPNYLHWYFMCISGKSKKECR